MKTEEEIKKAIRRQEEITRGYVKNLALLVNAGTIPDKELLYKAVTSYAVIQALQWSIGISNDYAEMIRKYEHDEELEMVN